MCDFPLILFEQDPVELNSIKFAGYSFVPPTPFPGKDFDKLDRPNDPIPNWPQKAYITENGRFKTVTAQTLFRKRSSIEEDLSRWNGHDIQVLIAHAPPYQTCLDRVQTGHPVGSRAIREWILRNKPLISLHGHIHESPSVSGRYWDYLGNTLMINPGQAEIRLSAIIIDINNTIEVEHTIYGPIPDPGEHE